jgi:hypothetical protein
MHENCSVRSFQMCVQEVIAGNQPALAAPRPSRGSADRSPAKPRCLLTHAFAHRGRKVGPARRLELLPGNKQPR